jgi:hypothetical protein
MALSLYLLIVIVFTIILPLFDSAFASPQFNRQEVRDIANDWSIKNTGTSETKMHAPNGESFWLTNAKEIDQCMNEDRRFISSDIESVSYLSNGETLDVTLWLASSFRNPMTDESLSTSESFNTVPWHYVGYTISIDVVSAYDAGPDYYATIKWDPTIQKWIQVLEEGSAITEQKRLIEQSEPTKFYDEGKNYILFSIPLEKVGSPQQYNLLLSTYDVFMQDDVMCYLVDITNWVQVPPPEFVITTTPNPILLRPDEKIPVEVQVKSLTNVKSNVQLSLDQVPGLNIEIPSNTAYVPPLGIGTLLLEVSTTNDVKYRTYTVPVYANHTFLSASKLRDGDYVHNQISTNTLDISNFIITVSPPLTIEEKFSKFWTTYGAVIGIVASAAVTVIIAPIVKKRIDERKKDDAHKEKKLAI